MTVVPAAPDVGLIPVRVGGGTGAETLNVTALLVPPLVVTVSVRLPIAAAELIVKPTVSDVEFRN